MDKALLQKMGSLFALSAESVLGVAAGNILFANPAAVREFGSIVGAPAASLIPEYILNEAEGSFVSTAVIQGKPVTLAVSRLEDVMLITTVREDERRREIQLSGVLAKLNSSMATLRITADRLVESLDMARDPKLEAYASALFHSYYTLLRATRTLTDLVASADAAAVFDPHPVDLAVLCSELTDTVNHLFNESGIFIDYSCGAEDYTAVLDGQRVQQLILNLLSNSIGHMQNGGDIHMTLVRQNERLVLTIADQGGGMDEEALRGAFSRVGADMDAQTIAGGAGLGLAMAHKIANMHKGSLLIMSHPGQGTTIKVLLPTGESSPSAPLRASGVDYRNTGMSEILTELSTVLPGKFYNKKYFD